MMHQTSQRPLRDLRPASPYRVALMLIAATAVLVGMLGMHAIAIGPAGHSHTASAHSHEPATSASVDAAGSSAGVVVMTDQLPPDMTAADDMDGCDDSCMVEMCLFVGMMCAMALLTATLALRSRRGTRLLFPLLPAVAPDPPIARLSAFARTPSLVALSISRT